MSHRLPWLLGSLICSAVFGLACSSEKKSGPPPQGGAMQSPLVLPPGTVAQSSPSLDSAGGVIRPSTTPAAQPIEVAPDRARMFRLYNSIEDHHFFTRFATEKDGVMASSGWIDESSTPTFLVFTTLMPGTVVVNRLKHPAKSLRYLTTNAAERDSLIAQGWIRERDEGFLYPNSQPGMVEIFHIYHKTSGSHMYTSSEAVKAAAQENSVLEIQTSLGWGPPQ